MNPSASRLPPPMNDPAPPQAKPAPASKRAPSKKAPASAQDLAIAAFGDQHVELAEMLSREVDPARDQNLLSACCIYGAFKCAQLLISLGADPHKGSPSPRDIAAESRPNPHAPKKGRHDLNRLLEAIEVRDQMLAAVAPAAPNAPRGPGGRL